MLSTGKFSEAFIDLGGSFVRRASVAQQGGLLNGVDPTVFSTSDPFRLWAIQLGVIMALTQILAMGLRKIRQPKVIAEVLGGILLGPTAMGRIPGFTNHIFPAISKPYLSLTAEIGLVLFMFLIGLEIDTKIIKRNAKSSVIIAIGGIAISFGLGCAVSIPIYHNFVESYNDNFSHFMLFVGVSFSITAFPVLCRILADLKMLHDDVGVVVLSAGVANDIVGWVLLALAVALVNAGTGLIALYVLLVAVGWTLVSLFPARWFFTWFGRWTGSVENGPTPLFMSVTILWTFANAFMTDIIGVNAIFGGFLAGLAIPRDGQLNIIITEKLEDTITLIFLPIYFASSGLNTNLGLLNTGKAWGFTFLLMVVDYSGKLIGGSTGARFAGLKLRECFTVGALMSCKGLLELIVLNVGLSAGILDTQVFSMFVFEALILTFATTPIATWLYPPHMRRTTAASLPAAGHVAGHGAATERKSHFLVVLDKMEHISSIMAITQLVQPPSNPDFPQATQVEALRLVELSDRTSDLMRSAAVEDLISTDPLLNIYNTFGSLHNITVSNRLTVAQHDLYHDRISEFASDSGAQMILLSWGAPLRGSAAEVATPSNPLEALFRGHGGSNVQERLTSVAHSHFIRRLFATAPTDVALFIDDQNGSRLASVGSKVHLVVAFFGGPDDRLALEFAVQLCAREDVSATVIRMVKATGPPTETPSDAKVSDDDGAGAENAVGAADDPPHNTVHSMRGFPDTIYPDVNTHTRLASDTADNISWSKYADGASQKSALVQSALSRMTFTTAKTTNPLAALVRDVKNLAAGKRAIVLAGRSKRLAAESHHTEMQVILGGGESGVANVALGNEMRRTLGDVATALLVLGVSAGLLVVQASAVAGETV